MRLSELKPGRSAVIQEVGGEGALRQHFLDMGVIPGTEVTVVKLAPMGDPMELRIHGYELTLRLADAEKIEIAPADRKAAETEKASPRFPEHPGLGEEGRFHPKGSGDPLPEGTTLTFALVGNQNCGKTTLFNQLTGSNQHVGNFPGVTVDRKDGVIRGYSDTLVTDLPGIYSMSPYSSEELVSRDFVLKGHPKAIINIVDATNIERNLYLTMQLLEMNIPMVVALNMMDELRGNGGTVDVNAMEALLGVPVVPISAAKNEGVDELIRHAIHVAKYQEKPVQQDFCGVEDHGGAVHRALHAVSHLIEDHARRAELPVRFSASKLIVGDPLLQEQLELDQNESEMLEHLVLQMEKERGLCLHPEGVRCLRDQAQREQRARAERKDRPDRNRPLDCDSLLHPDYGPGLLPDLLPDRSLPAGPAPERYRRPERRGEAGHGSRACERFDPEPRTQRNL